VIAGPAGFFPVREPKKHGGVGSGAGICPAGVASCTTEYTWLDPVTEPRGALGTPLYDLFLAVQDRSFNDDGSINFSNGLGQKYGGPVTPVTSGDPTLGNTSVTPGVNPQVHPTWLPEYFGDHVLVNGVLWPKTNVAQGWYRMRIVDGSDARCYTVGFSTQQPLPGTVPTNDVDFYVIANDQGYLQRPVLASQVEPVIGTDTTKTFTMCPGERYELLVNFAGKSSVFMTNQAPAPFPGGDTADSLPLFANMNVIMRFDVQSTSGVQSCSGTNNWNPAWTQPEMAQAIASGAACMPADPRTVTDPNFRDIRPPVANGAIDLSRSIVRQLYLNERKDPITTAPMGMQLNGVPFEYKVTETPKKGNREVWQFINLTVDAHPMHPHLVAHQIVGRQPFAVEIYKQDLCGAIGCMPGPAPGGEMQVVPDVNSSQYLLGAVALPNPSEGGRKDATRVDPGYVTTIVADWAPRWLSAGDQGAATAANAPGTGGYNGSPAPWTFNDVTTGPYVWHCHINSHEDSEMMRTSLVVK
jgi:spore coat protein A, manganese oxidase